MKSDLIVKHAENEDAVARAAGFLHGIFGHGRDYILNHPDIRRPRAIRYVEHQDVIVAAHVLESMTLSLGETWVHAARIEHVATAPGFRKRGLCRGLMNDSLTFLKTEGYQLALVFGYPLFRKFGFEYCIPTYEQTMPNYSPPGSAIIPTRGLSGLKASGSVRPMRTDEIASIAEVHRRDNPHGNLSRRRSRDYWRHLVQQRGLDTYLVSENGGEVTGYVRIESEGGSVQAREAVALDDASCEAILCHLYELATSEGAEVVVLFCPHSGTLGQYLRGHGAAQYAPDAQRETNLQMIVLDLPACLRALQPELSCRAHGSEFWSTCGRYNILTESAGVAIDLRRGDVTIVETTEDGENMRVSDRRMAQLLAGFRSHEASGHRLLDVLFPPGEPYWYVDDI
jgi:ribosomal protein S18 acetylase RimI-like enzyme